MANGQRLKVVFFPGQIGDGKVSMDELCHTNLWDGVGLGGSQKCEVATADAEKWDYDSVDVASLLEQEFRPGRRVDAWCDETKSWRMATVLEQQTRVTEEKDKDNPERNKLNTEVFWKVRCRDTECKFVSRRVCHTSRAFQDMIDRFGLDLGKHMSRFALCMLAVFVCSSSTSFLSRLVPILFCSSQL